MGKKTVMVDLTKGNPMSLIIGFALPMFLGTLFQQFYSMVDTIIVGKLLGLNALAGVGSTGAISFMINGFVIGLCSGFAIPVAQKFGAKQESKLRKYVGNLLWLSIIFSIVMTALIALATDGILRFMNTPEETFSYAFDYIFIIFLGIPTTFLYNMTSSTIRALEDSALFLDLCCRVKYYFGLSQHSLLGLRSGRSGLCNRDFSASFRSFVPLLHEKEVSYFTFSKRGTQTGKALLQKTLVYRCADGLTIQYYGNRFRSSADGGKRFGCGSDGSNYGRAENQRILLLCF